jgi:hypothetical protein
VVTINLELSESSSSEPHSWQQEVPLGETLGRLLARLAVERELVGTIYDASRPDLRPPASATINGRAYNLLGGLTYTLHEGDTISLAVDQATDSR